MKRMAIIGLILCNFLIATTSFVSAADVTLEFIDNENDVFDSNFDYVSRPNIDIKEVKCDQNGNEVVLKLKLVQGGIIQDSLEIAYTFLLTTTETSYSIGYGNGECEALDENSNEIDVKSCTVSGGIELQITIILPGDDEECIEVTGANWEFNSVTGETFFDTAPDEILNVDVSNPATGQTGKVIQFFGSASEGTPPYTYTWEFGDGGTSELQNPTHTYDTAGTYDIYLYVLDSEDKEGYGISSITIAAGNSDDDKSDSGSGLTIFIVLIIVIVIAGIVVLIFVLRR